MSEIEAPGTFYKYMQFSPQEFWKQPLTLGMVHFSSMDELRGRNDPDELRHVWDSNSYFVNRYFAPHMKPIFDKQFRRARIYCVGKEFNRKCWDAFIGSENGLCYQFFFKKNTKESDVYSKDVTYAKSKNLNAPSYVADKIDNLRIKALFLKEKRLEQHEGLALLRWLAWKKLDVATLDHLVNEVTYTKLEGKYVHEQEHRFAHLTERDDQPLKLKLIDNSKAKMSSLGLKIVKIYAYDEGKIKKELRGQNIEVCKPF